MNELTDVKNWKIQEASDDFTVVMAFDRQQLIKLAEQMITELERSTAICTLVMTLHKNRKIT